LKKSTSSRASESGWAGAGGPRPFCREHRVELATVRKLGEPVDIGQGLEHPPLPDHLHVQSHPRLDHGGVEGLGDVVRRAFAQSSLFGFGRVEASDEDHADRRGPRVLLEPAQHLVAVEVGHDHVEQDDVGVMLLGQVEAFFAVLAQKDGVFPLQQISEHLPVGRRVIDDQDFLDTRLAFPQHVSWVGL
jgi:hypothetical protein